MINKKGAELSINVIIIAILVILVLIIVAAFFTGTANQLFSSIKDIFTKGTSGTDRTLAEQFCQQYCDQAGSSQNPSKSSYCTQWFGIDENPKDGVADYNLEGDVKVTKKYYCGPTNSNSQYHLGISCADKQGQQILC